MKAAAAPIADLLRDPQGFHDAASGSGGGAPAAPGGTPPTTAPQAAPHIKSSDSDLLHTLLESSIPGSSDEHARRLTEQNEATSKRIEETTESVRKVYERLFSDGERYRERRRVYTEIGIMAESEKISQACTFQPELIARQGGRGAGKRGGGVARRGAGAGFVPGGGVQDGEFLYSNKYYGDAALAAFGARSSGDAALVYPMKSASKTVGRDRDNSSRGEENSHSSTQDDSRSHDSAFSRLYDEARSREQKKKKKIRQHEEEHKLDFHPQVRGSSHRTTKDPNRRKHSRDLFSRLHGYAAKYKDSKQKLAQEEHARHSFRPDTANSSRTGPQFDRWTPIWKRAVVQSTPREVEEGRNGKKGAGKKPPSVPGGRKQLVRAVASRQPNYDADEYASAFDGNADEGEISIALSSDDDESGVRQYQRAQPIPSLAGVVTASDSQTRSPVRMPEGETMPVPVPPIALGSSPPPPLGTKKSYVSVPQRAAAQQSTQQRPAAPRQPPQKKTTRPSGSLGAASRLAGPAQKPGSKVTSASAQWSARGVGPRPPVSARPTSKGAPSATAASTQQRKISTLPQAFVSPNAAEHNGASIAAAKQSHTAVPSSTNTSLYQPLGGAAGDRSMDATSSTPQMKSASIAVPSPMYVRAVGGSISPIMPQNAAGLPLDFQNQPATATQSPLELRGIDNREDDASKQTIVPVEDHISPAVEEREVVYQPPQPVTSPGAASLQLPVRGGGAERQGQPAGPQLLGTMGTAATLFPPATTGATTTPGKITSTFQGGQLQQQIPGLQVVQNNKQGGSGAALVPAVANSPGATSNYTLPSPLLTPLTPIGFSQLQMPRTSGVGIGTMGVSGTPKLPTGPLLQLPNNPRSPLLPDGAYFWSPNGAAPELA